MEDILKFDRLRRTEELDLDTKKKPKLVDVCEKENGVDRESSGILP